MEVLGSADQNKPVRKLKLSTVRKEDHRNRHPWQFTSNLSSAPLEFVSILDLDGDRVIVTGVICTADRRSSRVRPHTYQLAQYQLLLKLIVLRKNVSDRPRTAWHGITNSGVRSSRSGSCEMTYLFLYRT